MWGGEKGEAELQAAFANLARVLTEKESVIVGELNGSQGKPLDIGGYYHPDAEKASRALRPSATLNAALASR